MCEPFILRTGATVEKWGAWEQQISHYQQVVRQLADTFGAVHVPLQMKFDEASSRADAAYWIWDGVHPTAAGHALIADQWLSVVQEHGLL
ncbi:GDSL-like Lipase/Acylhydrolase [compost metagenome]